MLVEEKRLGMCKAITKRMIIIKKKLCVNTSVNDGFTKLFSTMRYCKALNISTGKLFNSSYFIDKSLLITKEIHATSYKSLSIFLWKFFSTAITFKELAERCSGSVLQVTEWVH